MIFNKERVLKNRRLCQAIFGVSREEIESLLPIFSQCLIAYRYQIKPIRQNKIGQGRKGDLPTDLDKLLYILAYLKVYPTYDAMSVLANHQRSKCGDSVKFLLPPLEMAIKRKLVLPKRKARTLEEIFQDNPELKDVFLDGSERRTQKPKDKKRRNKLYSGKKKATTRKNIILNDEKKKILFMSKTKSGRRHDKRIVDKDQLARHIPPDVAIWADTGLQGLQKSHPNVIMPAKASKNNPLTFEQKQNNRIISGIRVVSEHTIAGYKRFKATSDVYRNRLANMDDTMNLVCAGLWNLHLEQTV